MPEIKFIVRPFEDGWIAETIIDGYEIGFTAKTPLLALGGSRVNQWGHSIATGATAGDKDHVTCGGKRPSHKDSQDQYQPPVKANPGTLIDGIPVGGGLMGHKLAHENEAPFPVKLAEWFIRGWCKPGGVVLDPFAGRCR